MTRLAPSPPVGLLRRVLESQLDEYSRPTLAAFIPRPVDKAMLSVFLADSLTPEEVVAKGSTKHTYAVALITTESVAKAGALAPAADVHVVADSPPHCSINLTKATPDQCNDIAASLAGASVPPPPWTTFRPPLPPSP